ncbi:MAG: hypothetical protein AUI47_02085 [Acidobacteria bacterium 13_1_40CM_2_68_5]|nr:MAG: hypothetical protein AUI47_02085 [Acidobacteria bacterium 13_1_40CM_2_68_5]
MHRLVDDLIDEILRFTWSSNPTVSTAAGIHDHDHRLIDCAPDAIEARLRATSAYRRELARLERSLRPLPPADALDVRVLLDSLASEERLLEEVRAPFRDPAYYLDEILYGVYYLIEREFAPLPDRVRAAAARIGEVPRLLRQARGNLSDPRSIPKEWVTAALQQIQGSLAFLMDLGRQVAERAGPAGPELENAVREALRALEEFGEHLRGHLLAEAVGDFAIGRDLFEFLLRTQHGIDMDADALHEFGLRLMMRSQESLVEAARAIDPHRSWQDLVAEWKSDHPEADGFLVEYRREVERARAFVQERGVATLPAGERLHVVETPPFQRTVTPFAAYVAPAAFEDTQDAFFWVTSPVAGAPPEVRERMLQDHLRPGIPATVVHETYPGHHLQLSVATRIASKVRRFFVTPVLIEGWAFYCEEMMAEQSYYQDPRSQVLQLKDQLWRACRVVIDVGLHTRGMQADRAADMLRDVARLESPSARAEVLRYTRTPTQPMSYAVGKQAILDLREQMRTRLGTAFDLRVFHDELLSFGSIPIARIRERMTKGGVAPRGSS